MRELEIQNRIQQQHTQSSSTPPTETNNNTNNNNNNTNNSNGLPLPATPHIPPTSNASSPLGIEPLAALSSLENDPEAIKIQVKKLSEIIAQLQKFRENLRQQQEPQQDKVSKIVRYF